MFRKTISYIREVYNMPEGVIPLHAPLFSGNEKDYVTACIDSTFVSSVGSYVDTFEQKIAQFTGAKYAIATVNGTSALHAALILAGVHPGQEVLTQAVSFVATANAISYCGAEPLFLDIDKDTLGLSPSALKKFLEENTVLKSDGFTYNKITGKKILACVPVHIFGHPVKIDQIKAICDEYSIVLIEDAAESLGSFYQNKHTGTFGKLGVLSFNGNKIITTGGGGMILTNDDKLAPLAKHLTTTAKIQHDWEYAHDQIGYNYRLPNINAALGCAQMEQLKQMLARKRQLAYEYQVFFKNSNIKFFNEPDGCKSNYWLNTIVLENIDERNDFLQFSNNNDIMTRPMWRLLSDLPMYKLCQTDDLNNARWLQERLVNIPSSITKK